ncbi:hypothetical protein ABDK00_013560 [Niabella insulamsoli]|uniref:hypothetical protein n=1 Tax=Niabella insulamsoli TaxID=3144874 RepID=UPI0031FD5B8C
MQNSIYYTIAFLMMIASFTVHAQKHEAADHLSPPKTYWQSFGFQKQIDHVKIAYYKSDSLGYEPTMAEVISFNKHGHLIQHYIRIFGQYGSETAHNYVYTNGVLDSINTLATAANFNSRQKLHYNSDGQLTHITATGKFSNFTDTYKYDQTGMVASIERTHKSGSTRKAVFNHKANCVQERETAANGKVTERYYIYEGDELLASFRSGSGLLTFYDAYRRIDFETKVNEAPLTYALAQRKLKQSDPMAFNKQMSSLQSKPVSKIVFDIPALAKNENGDWIKRLQIDRRFSPPQRRLVFRKLMYADGTTSGDTEMDLIFERKVARLK